VRKRRSAIAITQFFHSLFENCHASPEKKAGLRFQSSPAAVISPSAALI
jgi:hypothetical protein